MGAGRNAVLKGAYEERSGSKSVLEPRGGREESREQLRGLNTHSSEKKQSSNDFIGAYFGPSSFAAAHPTCDPRYPL